MSEQMNPSRFSKVASSNSPPNPLATSEVLEGFESGFMVSSPVEVAVPEAFCDKIPLQTFGRSAVSTERIQVEPQTQRQTPSTSSRPASFRREHRDKVRPRGWFGSTGAYLAFFRETNFTADRATNWPSRLGRLITLPVKHRQAPKAQIAAATAGRELPLFFSIFMCCAGTWLIGPP